MPGCATSAADAAAPGTRRSSTGTEVKAAIFAGELQACETKRNLARTKIGCHVATVCRQLRVKTGRGDGQWNDDAKELLKRWLLTEAPAKRHRTADKKAVDDAADLERACASTSDALAEATAELEKQQDFV